MKAILEFVKKHDELCFAVALYVVIFGGIFFILSMPLPQEKTAPTPTAEPSADPTATPTPQDGIDIVFIDGIPTATLNYTQETPTPTQKPEEFTPTATPEPTATNTVAPTPTQEPQGTVKTAEVNGLHGWKPLAWYTACNDRSAPQWELQQIAKTDEAGRRIVQDSKGEWRFCVALPEYWVSGSNEDIGRCFDLIMANGATLKCVLGDTKKPEHSVNGECKYGIGHNEMVEVQCDCSKIPAIVLQMGDASYFGAEWQGDVAKVIVYDENALK